MCIRDSHNLLRALEQVPAQAETCTQIVGAPGGDIAHGAGGPAGNQTGDDLVEGAVAADGDDQIGRRAVLRGKPGRVAALAGDQRQADIVVRLEDADDVGQIALSLLQSGGGIQNQNQLFGYGAPPCLLYTSRCV